MTLRSRSSFWSRRRQYPSRPIRQGYNSRPIWRRRYLGAVGKRSIPYGGNSATGSSRSWNLNVTRVWRFRCLLLLPFSLPFPFFPCSFAFLPCSFRFSLALLRGRLFSITAGFFFALLTLRCGALFLVPLLLVRFGLPGPSILRTFGWL